jgi:predicted phosphodiesterase
MRIQLLSSLHNEFSDFVIPDTNAHVIVLAGDIDTGVRGVEWAKKLGKPVIYVRGNHEPFRQQIHQNLTDLRACAANSEVHVLEQDEVILSGVRFLGCTLWTDFNLFGESIAADAMSQAQQHLNDFTVIKNGEGALTPATTRIWHKESVVWLEAKLAEPFDGKTVVVTHHAPHKKCVHPRYARNIISAGFASDLEHLMGKADLWLFGESHLSIDTKVNGTRIISNPRGFSWFENGAENPHFISNMVLNLTGNVRVTGEDKLLPNAEIHAMLAAVQTSDVELQHPSGTTELIKGVFVDDFPADVYRGLLKLAQRAGIQRDKNGRMFVGATSWRAIVWRTDPDT